MACDGARQMGAPGHDRRCSVLSARCGNREEVPAPDGRALYGVFGRSRETGLERILVFVFVEPVVVIFIVGIVTVPRMTDCIRSNFLN